MPTWVFYAIFLALLLGLFWFNARNRRRQFANEQERRSRIGAGSEVMTTSGLYGTVVTRNDDDTVILAIAPGVEVRWAAAALRDPTALTSAYSRPSTSLTKPSDPPHPTGGQTGRSGGSPDGTPASSSDGDQASAPGAAPPPDREPPTDPPALSG